MPTFTGTPANDSLNGGSGNDSLTGGLGNDVIRAGAGDDSLFWTLGDGSDTVDGGAGTDAQNVTAGAGADVINVVAAADHAIVSVHGATAVDMLDIETLSLKPLAGADTVNIGDLTVTALRTLNLDLAGAAGSPDNAADTVNLSGASSTPNQASVILAADGRGLQMTDAAHDVADTTHITGLDAKDQVNLTFGSSDDSVTISGPASRAHVFVDLGGGNDTAQAAAGPEELHGGDGNDVIGSADGAILEGDAGDDTLTGAINDVLFGGDGNDVLTAGDSTRAFGEAGDDTLIVAAGKNGAQVAGGDGDDTLFAGAGNNELHGDAGNDSFTFTMSARDTSQSLIDGGDGDDTLKVVAAQDGVGAHVTLSGADALADIHVTREDDAGTNIPTDAHLSLQGVEHVVLTSGAGADTFDIADMTGPGVTQIDIDLSVAGAPDGVRDTVNLTAPADAQVTSLHAADGLSEQITYTVGGAVVETINVSGLDANDVVTIGGGATRDIAGTDQPDVIEVGDPTTAGFSTVNIDLAGANGAPDGAIDTVNLIAPADALVVTALGDDGVSEHVTYAVDGVVVETINVGGLDPADVVNISGSSLEPTVLGTSKSESMNWALGDGRKMFDGGAGTDTLNVAGTSANQSWVLSGPDAAQGSGGLGVPSAGLVDFTHIEAFNISLGDGADQFLDAMLDVHAAVRVDGGPGDDLLIGGAGNDTLQGGDGADTLQSVTVEFDQQLGPDGNDSLSGGNGDDLFGILPNTGSGDLQGASTIDGGAGVDTFTFARADPQQSLVLTPQGGHGILSDNGVKVADIVGVEKFLLSASSTGHDFVTIGDIAGAQEVDVDFGAGASGLPDHVSDTLIVNASPNGSHIDVESGIPNFTVITGLSETIRVADTDERLDGIEVLGGAGNDTISFGGSVQPGFMGGGAGNDSLSAGGPTTGEFSHVISGGDGNDTLGGGLSDDIFLFVAGETGRDVVLNFQTHQHGISVHGDKISLDGFADHSLADLINHGHIHQSGADVVVTDGTNDIVTIRNILVSALGDADFTSDFIPSPPPPILF